MSIEKIASYWSRITRTSDGRWVHPDDLSFIDSLPHSFNLDYPPPAFVGNILDARIIVLTANGGYSPGGTPREFAHDGAEQDYCDRLSNPSISDWSAVAPYYAGVNYSDWLVSGVAAAVNACAYRSPKISQEPDNKKLIKKLPSVAFHRSWLLETVLPLAVEGKILVVAKRHGLWNLPKSFSCTEGVIMDPAPVSPYLAKEVMQVLESRLDGV